MTTVRESRGPSTAFADAIAYVLGSVGHRIRRCHQISVGLFVTEVGGFNLTTIQYAALAAIAAHDDIDATRLAAVVAFDRSTVGIVLKALETKGFIVRELRPHDKRTKRLNATDKGRHVLLEADAAVHRSQDRFLAMLDPADRETFMRLLAAVIASNDRR
jgi:DNA-binding MarR family transcriptional regulator